MNAALKQELRNMNVVLDRQIEVIREQAKKMGVPANTVMTMDGAYVLAPVVIAKAQVLCALADLENR